MAKRLLVSFLAMLPLAANASELGLEEVVSRHVAAKGGHDALRAVSAVRLRGQYAAFGEVAPFELVRARPQLYRFDFSALGSQATYAWDGSKAWWINPAMGYTWAVAPPLPERRFLYSESLFENPLIDAETRGISLRLGAPGDLDGAPTVIVVATLADGSEETWHLDPNTWLEVKRESLGADYGREVPCITYFADFRKVHGVQFPFRIEQEYSIRWRTFEIENIEINPVLDAAVFRLPIDPVLGYFAGLGGRWQVTYESVAYPSAPRFESVASSSIGERFDGRLFEEEAAVVTATAAYNEHRLLSWDRFRERWTLVVHDDLSASARVLFGTLRADSAIVFDTLTSTTPDLVGDRAVHSRYTINRGSADELSMVVETSNDGGESWTPGYSAHYRRASGD